MSTPPSLPDRSPPPEEAPPPAEGTGVLAASRQSRRVAAAADATSKTRRAPASKRASAAGRAPSGPDGASPRVTSRTQTAKTEGPTPGKTGKPTKTKTTTPKAKAAGPTPGTSVTPTRRSGRSGSKTALATSREETSWEPRRLIPLAPQVEEVDDGPKRLLPAPDGALAGAPGGRDVQAAGSGGGFGVMDLSSMFAPAPGAWAHDEYETGEPVDFDVPAPLATAPDLAAPSPWERPTAAPASMFDTQTTTPVSRNGASTPVRDVGGPSATAPRHGAAAPTSRLPFDGTFHDQTDPVGADGARRHPRAASATQPVREFFTVLGLAIWRPVRRLGQVGVGLAILCALMGLGALGLFTWRHLTPTDLAANVMAMVSPTARPSAAAAAPPPLVPDTARPVVAMAAEAPRVAQGYLLTLHTYDQRTERAQYQRAQSFLSATARAQDGGSPPGARDGGNAAGTESVLTSRRIGAGVRRSLVVEQVRTAYEAPQASWVVTVRGYVLEMTTGTSSTPPDIRGPRPVDFVVRLGRCERADSLCVLSATPDPWAADVLSSRSEEPPRLSSAPIPMPPLRRDTLSGPRKTPGSRAPGRSSSLRVGSPVSARVAPIESPRLALPMGDSVTTPVAPPALRPLSPSLNRPTERKPPEASRSRPQASVPRGSPEPRPISAPDEYPTPGGSSGVTDPLILPTAPPALRPLSPTLNPPKGRTQPESPGAQPKTSVPPGTSPPLDRSGAPEDISQEPSPSAADPVVLPGALLPSDLRPVAPTLDTPKERILPDAPLARPRIVFPGLLPLLPDLVGATGEREQALSGLSAAAAGVG